MDSLGAMFIVATGPFTCEAALSRRSEHPGHGHALQDPEAVLHSVNILLHARWQTVASDEVEK